MSHDIRRYMDAVSTLTEAAKPAKLTPAQRFVQTIRAGPRCKHCTFEVEGPRTVLLTWLEGGGGLVPYLTQIADKLRVKLTLMVEVVDTAYGGKLVRYYEKHGFEIKESDFDDDFDFMTMEPDPSDELKGQVYMERKPYAKPTLGEGAAAGGAMPQWFTDGHVLSPDDLARLDAAEFIEGNEFDYEWRLCRVPVSLLTHARLSDDDIAFMDSREPGRMDRVRDMMQQGQTEDSPVVLLLVSNGTIKVLDGYHRITAAIEAGHPAIHAAVGLGDPDE